MKTRVPRNGRPARTKKPFGASLTRRMPTLKAASGYTKTTQHTGSANGQDTIHDTD